MIIKNVRLIPELTDGKSAEKGTVIIKDGIIVSVLTDNEAIEAEFANDPEIIDGEAKTLIPGIIDAHTHMSGLRDFDPEDAKRPDYLKEKTVNFAARYLDYGVTTIRDCGCIIRVNNYVRDVFESQKVVGPRVISCGLILSPTEVEEEDDLYDIYSWCDGYDESLKAARKEMAQHADFIKIMASGSALHRAGIPKQPIMLEEELRAIVAVANMKDTYVAAHAHADGAIRMCIDGGVRTIEHASFISDESIDALMKRDNCYLVPTVSAFYQNPITTPPEYQFLVKKLKDMVDVSAVCLNKAYLAGAKIAFGTDSTCGMDQYEQGIEFRYRKELCHMKDIDILLQATKNSAHAIGIENITGEIKKGLSADLLLIDGRPDEDISCMYQKPKCVISQGRIIKMMQ